MAVKTTGSVRATTVSEEGVRLAVTLGDPRGIGPEVTRKALADARVQQVAAALDIT